MTKVRCPKDSCLFWQDGWCQSDEIELDPLMLACMTFEEAEEADDELDDGLDWDDDEALNEDELDESLYDDDPVEMELFDDDLDEPELEDEFEVIDPDEEEW